jgi:hypothetical protein
MELLILLITPSAGLLLPSLLISDDVTLRAIKRKKKTWNIINRRDLFDAWKIKSRKEEKKNEALEEMVLYNSMFSDVRCLEKF